VEKLVTPLPLPLFTFDNMLRSAVSKSVLNAVRQTVSKTTVRPVIARGYHENVISHYEKPRNVSRPLSLICLDCNLSDNISFSLIQVGSLPKGDVDVGTGLVGAPAYVAIHCSVSFTEAHVRAAAETS
jgi:hypothetical protein